VNNSRELDCRIEVLQGGVWTPRWWRPAADGWAKRTYADQVRNAECCARFIGGEYAGDWEGLRLVTPKGQVLSEWLRPCVQESLF